MAGQTRPTLRVGDVVKWHKKACRYSPNMLKKTMVVIGVPADTQSKRANIKVFCSKTGKVVVHRHQIWKTGYNVFDAGKSVSFSKKQQPVAPNLGTQNYFNPKVMDAMVELAKGVADKRNNTPQNNDGRTHCYKCGAPTKEVNTGFSIYKVCTQCGA